MRVAVCEFNPTVGAIKENAEAILRIYDEIAAQHHEVDLVVFPEMALTGYPIEDLALSTSFVAEVEDASYDLADEITLKSSGPALIFGTIGEYGTESPPHAMNMAFAVEPGGGIQFVVKHEMANYGVFDEKRTFIPASHGEIAPITLKGQRIGLLICEDGWHPDVPKRLASHDNETLDLFVWINGSPYEYEKQIVRRDVALKNFSKFQIPVIYANMCGGQDELVFDGDSFMLGSAGLDEWLPAMTAGDRFRPNNILYFDTCTTVYSPADMRDTTPSIYAALVLGVRDYMRKQKFTRAVLGMSGGVDSALVAAIACDAIGPENVDLVSMPSRFSSEGSQTDAREATDRLGAAMRTHPIERVAGAVRDEFEQVGSALTGLAAENIQARIRGLLLMAISNQEGSLLLTTGNKSENSTGFCTIFGCVAGGFNPLKDVYKTTAWDLCRFRNGLTPHQIKHNMYLGKQGEVIPIVIIDKPPSAELAEGQRDDQSLPPYPVLDAILKLIIENFLSNKEIIDKGFDAQVVERIRTLVDRAEYKRRQAAPGVKITPKLHGRDRRVPIVNKWHG